MCLPDAIAPEPVVPVMGVADAMSNFFSGVGGILSQMSVSIQLSFGV